jgi:flavin reductase (DIM6/NTAB) family NADH-FMN oxidoreductase RutF
VVNLVDEAVAEAMNKTAASLPYGANELEAAGLTTLPSSSVKPPRIAESPASLECAEWGTLQIGGNRLIIGCLDASTSATGDRRGRIRSERFHVINHGQSECVPDNDRFEMVRPP